MLGIASLSVGDRVFYQSPPIDAIAKIALAKMHNLLYTVVVVITKE